MVAAELWHGFDCLPAVHRSMRSPCLDIACLATVSWHYACPQRLHEPSHPPDAGCAQPRGLPVCCLPSTCLLLVQLAAEGWRLVV